jgi:hypothetical protein
MTNPQGPRTVIVTYSVTADQLPGMTGAPNPFFISDGDRRQDPHRGWTGCLRMVSVVNDEGGSAVGHRTQISVEFADGTPGRLFDPNDPVEVHIIVPGPDLIEALSQFT